MLEFGCDEAGKGPVIGSMFISCVHGNPNDLPDGIRDSKKLSTSKIHRLRKEIIEAMEVYVVEIEPSKIDSQSMTDCSRQGFCESIQGVNYSLCDAGYIDSYVNNKKTVQDHIEDCLDLDDEFDLVVEFGADEKYDIVSAAGIVSKSHREDHIEEISDKYGDVGSGYPSDPTTRDFLKQYVNENDDVPDVARRSWSTCQDLLDENRS